MHIEYKPWMKRQNGDYPVTKQTALALMIDGVWTPKSGLSNLAAVMDALNATQNAPSISGETTPTHFVLTPWEHQRRAYVYVMDMWSKGQGCLLEFGMGTGKTRISIDVIQNYPNVGTVLILCPKSVINAWPREFAKHGVPGKFSVMPLDKYSVAKRAEIAVTHTAQAQAKGLIPVIVVNYDVVWREDFAPALKNIGTLICDESQKIKGYGGTASKFVGKLAQKIPLRLALTGTPLPNGPMDIFGQYRAICPNVFGMRFTPFRSRYAVMGGFQAKQIIGFQNEAEFREKYLSHALQCSRDVLDLPEALHIVRTVTLDPSTMRLYKEMEKEMVIEIGAGVVTASNALAKLLRLAQITGGTVPTTEGTGAQVGTEKRDDLQDLMESLPPLEPLVVFCRFHSDLNAVHEAARLSERCSLELSGRRNELSQWQSGAAPVLAVQIQAGGVGIDLTRACYVCYLSVGYSLGDYQQSLARSHRPGQHRPVTFYHIVAEHTIDETIYKCLENKKDIVESIIGELTTSTKSDKM
jgi:SNF2 family DNA or RNA helicase